MNLEARMLEYEARESRRQFMPRLPIMVRLDGRCFSGLTQQCVRPFDPGFHTLMCKVVNNILEDCSAPCAYTESDEITLALWHEDRESQPYFGGRVQKVVSSLAALASAWFNAHRIGQGIRLSERIALFDCRAWQVPSLEEAANVFIWREQDAARNSVQMAARAVFSHKQCHKKNASELQDMLHEKGINWNDYPAWAKRGTYLIRRKVTRLLTPEELERIPPEHVPEDGVVERNEYEPTNPRLAAVANRVDYLFREAVGEPLKSP